MPIPLETAAATYKEMSRILPFRFRRRGKKKQQPPEERGKVVVLGSRTLDMDVQVTAKDLFLEPPNPFDSQAKRNPRRGVALFGGLVFVLLVVFLVSSFVSK